MEGLGTSLRKLLDALDGGVQSHYEAAGSNFRPRFYPVARLLLVEETLSIRTLANASGVSHSAVSQTVAEMRAAGLVDSSPGKDGRERLIRLTAAGLDTCARLQPLWDAIGQAEAALDAELSMPLGTVLREAAARLEAEGYASRISRQLDSSSTAGAAGNSEDSARPIISSPQPLP